MVSIDADKYEIERCIARLVNLCETGGSHFVPDLVIKCHDGNLWVEAEPGMPGREIMTVPAPLLLPMKKFGLAVQGDDIVIASHDSDVSSTRLALVEAMLELYNLTGKIASHRRFFPRMVLLRDPILADFIRRGRPNVFSPDQDKLAAADDSDNLVLSTFLKTRTLGFREKAKDGNENPDSEPSMLPVIDFLDHSFRGPHFLNENGSNLKVVRSATRSEGDRACYCCYGPLDNFDSWVSYGFVDDATPHVRSIPMRLDLPDIGIVHVGSLRKFNKTKGVPQRMALYQPVMLKDEDGKTGVEFIVIPAPNSPRALRRILHMLINTLDPSHPKPEELVHVAEEQILAENRAYYQDLQILLRSLTNEDPTEKKDYAQLFKLCDIQLARLDAYPDFALDPQQQALMHAAS